MGIGKRGEKDRRSKKRERRSFLLFALEGGNKTERIYLDHFRNTQQKYKIRFAPGDDTDPEQMSGSLKKQMRKMDFDTELGDAAFCVFDLDVDSSKKSVVQRVLKNADAQGYDCVISNPCFEVWYLCYFGYSTKQFDRSSKVIAELNKHIPEYEKSKDIFNKIESKTKDAITNAKRLQAHQISEGLQRGDTNAHPVTEMYKVVELLSPQ